MLVAADADRCGRPDRTLPHPPTDVSPAPIYVSGCTDVYRAEETPLEETPLGGWGSVGCCLPQGSACAATSMGPSGEVYIPFDTVGVMTGLVFPRADISTES